MNERTQAIEPFDLARTAETRWSSTMTSMLERIPLFPHRFPLCPCPSRSRKFLNQSAPVSPARQISESRLAGAAWDQIRRCISGRPWRRVRLSRSPPTAMSAAAPSAPSAAVYESHPLHLSLTPEYISLYCKFLCLLLRIGSCIGRS